MSNYVVTLKRSSIISASPIRVFAAATDWPRQAEWIPATRVTPLVLGGQAAGGSISAFTGIGRFGFVDTMTIVEWKPPHRCRMHHTGRVVRGDGVFEVTPHGDNGSIFSWAETVILPFGVIGKIGWIITKPITLFAIGLALKRFKRWVERV
ncbi:SRPBCC family protein [Candidatus Saccharibacteria bacterium]|nr:SRPBCC family protein [Candidatus Saccharibacteria bacterium]